MKNSVVELLRKLISHEKSARDIGSIQEAEAFAGKIQELLDLHKLGMSDVEWDTREQEEPIDWEAVGEHDPDFKHSKTRKEWQTRIAACIAACNGCKLVLGHRKEGNSVSFVGRTSDRELCKIMFIYMLNLAYDLNALCAEQDKGEQKFKYVLGLKPWQDFDINAFRTHMREFKRSWFAGFSVSVSNRLMEQRTRMKQAAVVSGAMVHINRDAIAIRDYLRGQTQKTRQKGQRDSTLNTDGYNRGKQTGSAVNLSPNNFGDSRGGTSRLLPAA